MRLCTGMVLVFTAACTSTSDVVTDAPDVRGTWRYTATQSAPPLTAEGTLVLREQNTAGFSGSIDLHETDAQGFQYAYAGLVSGRALDASGIDFDAFVEGKARRHVGRINADTMTGAWVVQSAGAAPLTGTFRAVRTER